MKRLFTKLLAFTAFTTALFAVACTPEDSDTITLKDPTVSSVTATDTSVAFHVNATEATGFGYICMPKGETADKQTIIEKGNVVEQAEADCTIDGLTPETEYTLYVVSTTEKAFSKVVAVNFTTSKPTSITISNVVPSYNSVTFDVSAQNASVIAFACVPAGEKQDGSWIFDNGTVVGKSEGSFECKKLTADTEYSLLVVSSSNDGLSAVYSADFRTLVDSGTPSDDFGAGIRITKIETNNVYFDIINGNEIDKSFVSIWGKATLENTLMETMKGGMTEDAAIKELISTTGYMAFTVLGKGTEVKNLDYQTQMTASLFPDQHYVILTIGCVGDEMKEVTIQEFTTEGFELIGDPAVEITTEASYISFVHHFTPNADADYYFYFGTLTDQADEFIKHFDDKYGAGFGERMLKEFIRDYDIFYMDKTDESDFGYTVGFDREDIMFSIFAFGADKNLMMGSKLSRDDVHTLPIPTSEPAVFSIAVDRVATTSARFKLSFGDNCGRIYVRPIEAGSYDPETADQVALARSLFFDGGWVYTRPSDGSYPEGTEYYKEEQYYAELAPGQSYQLIATGLNYKSGLSPIFCSEPFTMKDYVFEGSEAVGELSLVSAARQTAKINYKFDENCAMLYHRLVQRGGGIYDNLTEEELIKCLINEVPQSAQDKNPQVDLGGEMWAAYDPSEDKPLNWDWVWTGLEAGLTYDYYYTIEDFEGRLTALRKLEFTTKGVTPGPNPDVSLTVNKVTRKEVFVDIVPNEDCGSILYCAYRAEEFEKADQTKEELETALKDFVVSNGLTGVDAYYDRSFDLLYPDIEYYVMAVGIGEASVVGPLHYEKFLATDGEQPEYAAARPESVNIWSASPVGKSLRSGSPKEAASMKAANRAKAEKLNRGMNPTFVERVDLPELPANAEFRVIDFKEAAAQMRNRRNN